MDYQTAIDFSEMLRNVVDQARKKQSSKEDMLITIENIAKNYENQARLIEKLMEQEMM